MTDEYAKYEAACKKIRAENKENMPDWLATMDRYDDPGITDPRKIWDL